MKKNLILFAITLITLFAGGLTVYAREYIVNENNYSIGKDEKKVLINNYYLSQTLNINGDYSGMASGSGYTSTKFVLAKSPRLGYGYMNVETKHCPTNMGGLLTFKSVLGNSYMKITNDNTDDAAWCGNVRFYI